MSKPHDYGAHPHSTSSARKDSSRYHPQHPHPYAHGHNGHAHANGHRDGGHGNNNHTQDRNVHVTDSDGYCYTIVDPHPSILAFSNSISSYSSHSSNSNSYSSSPSPSNAYPLSSWPIGLQPQPPLRHRTQTDIRAHPPPPEPVIPNGWRYKDPNEVFGDASVVESWRCPKAGCESGVFDKVYHLNAHIYKSHRGEPLFFCPYPGCGLSFTTGYERTEHATAVHRRFKCGACRRGFARQNDLDRHLQAGPGAPCREKLAQWAAMTTTTTTAPAPTAPAAHPVA